jgi:hypothetical protein
MPPRNCKGFMMKSYPSIGTKFERTKVVAFDKLDGSNIRAEWSSKKGFYKFGSRNQLIDRNQPILGKAVDLIVENYQEQLGSIFSTKKWERAVAFFEFYGECSFAGSHDENDEHKVTLIDVNVYKRGMIEPLHFIELFEEVGIPKVLFRGVLDERIVTEVKNGILEGMTFEGVVCKYHNPKNKIVKMFKIKNRSWIERLKEKCDGNDALFRRLV